MLDLDWYSVISSGDAETIWNALYLLVRYKAPISQYWGKRVTDLHVEEFTSEVTQEVFLSLISGDRLSYFLRNNHTNDQIESELILNELAAVLMSRSCRAAGEHRTGDEGATRSASENLEFLMGARH